MRRAPHPARSGRTRASGPRAHAGTTLDPAIVIERLATTADRATRRAWLVRASRTNGVRLLSALADEVPRRGRVDLGQAQRLADACAWLAQQLGDPYGRGRSLRAMGHLHALKGDSASALASYTQAVSTFDDLGQDVELAITLSGALQTLIYRGAYAEAERWAARARRIFRAHHDTLRLARLDSNVGNIFYRQDRFAEALRLYRRAYRTLRSDHPHDAAITLRNMAGCYANTAAVDEALETYAQASRYCKEQGLPLLAAEADYNIAYLHYGRGEYTRAIDLYHDTRERCRRLGDAYHAALCDLDQAELYLELNLTEDATSLAKTARTRFAALGMRYERAKASVTLAMGAARRGNREEALTLLEDAQSGFAREGNHVWAALVDLYRVDILLDHSQHADPRALAERAKRRLAAAGLPSREALADLALARLDLDEGDPDRARTRSRQVLARIRGREHPALAFQLLLTIGRANEATGRLPQARTAYRDARAQLESMRTHLRGDDMKIAFLRDKLALYEGLVALAAHTGRVPRPLETIALVEEAKSRSLADLLITRGTGAATRRTGRGASRRRVQRLRQDLTWTERQIDHEELKGHTRSATRIRALRHRARASEQALTRALRELRATDREFEHLQNGRVVDLRTVQASLPGDTTILEYFEARGRLFACVIGPRRLEVLPLGDASRARERFRLLQFQLAKFQLTERYTSTFRHSLLEVTSAHLGGLFDELIQPVAARLDTERLVVVPHGFLHYLPFHALHRGGRALIDDHIVTYAPSATVFHLCCQRSAPDGRQSLILGVPDARMPHALEEVERLGHVLPGARVFLGADATRAQLIRHARRSRFVHIATHGSFRQDNPLFSSLTLADGPLTVIDVYDLELSADLVSLSGCGTGLNVLTGGDELLGLVRGWLHAGTRSVLVTLWDVNDQSTAEYMTLFYANLGSGLDKGQAYRQAMLEVRRTYAHPYFWAPFALVGDGGQASSPDIFPSPRPHP